MYNFDKTNLTNNPGSKKVTVPNGMKDVEHVQEHLMTSISFMVCGNAAKKLLPPFTVHKGQNLNNLYVNWTSGAKKGTKYDVAGLILEFSIHVFLRNVFPMHLIRRHQNINWRKYV